jgi:hypothetical protein
MVTHVFFNKSCPVCGRTLKILVTLLGRRVYCQHCGGGFVASDDSLRVVDTEAGLDRRPADVVEALLERADWTLRHGVGDPSGCEVATD